MSENTANAVCGIRHPFDSTRACVAQPIPGHEHVDPYGRRWRTHSPFTQTTGVDTPFGSVGSFDELTDNDAPQTHERKENMASTTAHLATTALWSLSDIARELGVKPQLVSTWARGSAKTPIPKFHIEGSGAGLWTIDDVELWHDFYDARKDAAVKRIEAKTAKSPVIETEQVEEMPKAKAARKAPARKAAAKKSTPIAPGA